jgi:hypothetical protein
MKKIGALMLLFFWSFLGTLHAEKTDSTEQKTRSFQFSFITPVGTNGLQSWNTTNRFSINLLAGYAAGVNGVEFSGLTSVLKNNMRGAQFAGLGNVVLGETKGAQFSGLFNIGLKETQAWQFAGFMNMNLQKASGVQCGGFTNIVASEFSGGQFAGFSNIATRESRGLQIAGFANYAKGGKVVQLSGFGSVVADTTKGTQISGFGNVAIHSYKGLQMAGAVNIQTGKIKGAQISGLFNYASRLKGVQVAPFNYVDSLEKGVPIGVLSFVRNGFMAFEFTATETLYGIASFKTGVKQFYNILSVGTAYRSNMWLWGFGYGIGGMIPLSDKWNLSIEGTCYQMNEGEWFTNRLNLWNKLSATAGWQVAKHLTILAGVSWNVTVSDITDEYGDPVTPHIAPWWVYNETNDNINIRMYPGFVAGIRIH